MPRKSESQEVKNALTSQAITDVQKDIATLSTVVKDGFAGVHTRQDTTNGRISTNEKDLLLLKEKFKYNRIVWYLFTVTVGALVALASYILYH